MTAKEARILSKENMNSSTRAEQLAIINEIKKAAEEGYYSIIIYYKISNYIKEYFLELGYIVKLKPQNNQPNEIITFIKW